MIDKINIKHIVTLSLLYLGLCQSAISQIYAGGEYKTAKTVYESGQQDSIYIYLSKGGESGKGNLLYASDLVPPIDYRWEKYNSQSGNFESYNNELSSSSANSEIRNLADGCYRVYANNGTSNIYSSRVWVFNHNLSCSAKVVESNCAYYQMEANVKSDTLYYHDVDNGNTRLMLYSMGYSYSWTSSEGKASVESPTFYDPPANNTDYTLTITDGFGYKAESQVTYESIVPKVKFHANPQKGEAPLDISFENETLNADLNSYEWSLYRSDGDLANEGNVNINNNELDSVMLTMSGDNPSYLYDVPGTYNVRLTAFKVSGKHTCYDTAYIDDKVDVDSSYIECPNVFTPNGDGMNDVFVVKTLSLKSMSIIIKNRWQSTVHKWSSDNIFGSEDVYYNSVWDGKINGSYASPGVYFYVIQAEGRDGRKHKESGFIHLFRNK
ncbi:MAG: gliding motility-associated C-terminal domain-containing protein [Bacteroidales bacterium]